jgi:hypothetical protein
MAFGQRDTVHRESGKIAFRGKAMAIDSFPLMVDYEAVNSHPVPAFFINEKFYPMSIIASLDPAHVDSFKVVEEDTVINGELYHGKIYITVLDDAFEIKEISLSAIKEKYTDLKEQPAVFIIDGRIITRDYDTYLMDENILYTISTGNIKNPEIFFVNILTKSEENIKKQNTFHIKGIKWEK